MKIKTFMIGGNAGGLGDPRIYVINRCFSHKTFGWATRDGPQYRIEEKASRLVADLKNSDAPFVRDGLYRAYWEDRWPCQRN